MRGFISPILFSLLFLTLTPAQVNAPKLFIPVTDYDFGEITEGQTVEHLFILKNTGKAPLEIRSATPDCNCTKVRLSTNRIRAGKEGEIIITYNSQKQNGSFTKLIIIETNDPAEPVQMIKISGKQERLKLELGDHLKRKIHALIRTEKHSSGYLSGLFLGVLVGLLELPCTGQVYFPIIMMVREVNPARIKAIAYLLLYNLIFILPLIIVFSGVYFGLSSGNLTRLIRDHLAKVKLMTAFFFFGLALLLVAKARGVSFPS